MVVKKIYLFFVIISIVHCEGRNFQAPDGSPELSEESREKIDVDQWLRDKQSQIVALVKGKCEKRGRYYLFTEEHGPFQEMETCFRLLREDVVEGDETTDDILIKSCAKTPQFEECVADVAARLRRCLSPQERLHLNHAMDAARRLFEFLCLHEEDELEPCPVARSETTRRCYNDMIDALHRHDANSADVEIDDDIFEIPLVAGLCIHFAEYRNCLLHAYRRCQESAHYVNSTLGIVLEGLPCDELMLMDIADAESELPLALSLTDTVSSTEMADPVGLNKAADVTGLMEATDAVNTTEAAGAINLTEAEDAIDLTEVTDAVGLTEEAYVMGFTEVADEVIPTVEAVSVGFTEETETIGATEATDAVGLTEAGDAVDFTETVDAMKFTEGTDGMNLTEEADAMDTTEAAVVISSTEATGAINSTETTSRMGSAEARDAASFL